MFSMYRSQKNIQSKGLDYKALYLQEKRLKEDYLKRAQVAELKYKKLAQSINKKCVRCMNIEQKKTKQQKILQLKQFTNGLNLLNMQSTPFHPIAQQNHKQKIIKNFGIFGVPESMLIQPQHCELQMEGEMIYVSDIPSIVEQHAAKLCFSSGICPQYFTGIQAREKAIQIMSSSSSNAKSFIMSFEYSKQNQLDQCVLRNTMNPQNKLYAICLVVDDFSLVPNWNTQMIVSDKIVRQQSDGALSSVKVLSCEQTDISYHNDKDCSIVVTPRVYCIFSHYPFITFYQQILRSIVNSVKTQRLVIYRESGSTLAEADSHFFLQRAKQTYKQISSQLQHWQIKINQQYELKMVNFQKIPLSMNFQHCSVNFVQDWGLSIINLFNVDTFLDVFTLMMLEQKIVFVTQNPTILTFAIHLFTQLLPRPFQYPFPVINMLPSNQGYFSTPCPFVYGVLNSKKNLVAKKSVQNNPHNTFIFLQKQGVEILSYDSKKSILKKKSKLLKQILTTRFKSQADRTRRVSNLMFADEQINFTKDKLGISLQIVKSVNEYLNDEVLQNLPKHYQVNQIFEKIKSSGLKPGQDLHQLALQKIKKQCSSKSKEEFFLALLETQIVGTFLFK